VVRKAVKFGKKVSMNLSLNEDTMTKWMFILENERTINLEVIQQLEIKVMPDAIDFKSK